MGKIYITSILVNLLSIAFIVLATIVYHIENNRTEKSRERIDNELSKLIIVADSINQFHALTDHNNVEVNKIKYQHDMENSLVSIRSDLSKHILNNDSVIDNELSRISNWIAVYVVVLSIVMAVVSLFFSINTSSVISKEIDNAIARLDDKRKDLERDIDVLWNLEPIELRSCYSSDHPSACYKKLLDLLNKLKETLLNSRPGERIIKIVRRYYKFFNNEDIMHTLINDRASLRNYTRFLHCINEYQSSCPNERLASRIKLQTSISALIDCLDRKQYENSLKCVNRQNHGKVNNK